MVKPNAELDTFTSFGFTANSRGREDLFFYSLKGEQNETKYNIK